MAIAKNRYCVLAGLMLCAAQGVSAQEGSGVVANSPLTEGPYLSLMGTRTMTDADAFDDGIGGLLAAGYRRGPWAVEGSVVLGRYGGAEGNEDTDVMGGTINGLLFPFSGLPTFYWLIGGGGLDVDRHPRAGKEYSLTTVESGLGYILPLAVGRYAFGIRADARYRYGHREKGLEADRRIETERDYRDVLLNLGLQLPLGLRPERKPEPEPVARVVPVSDADGDGVLDDTDQCPDTPAGTAVDAVGCPLPPPPPPCKTPAPGEKVSLAGCGTGDVIVLRGVNFEYDQARLTANAKTILDNVGEELVAHPAIEVELSGHTDSRGSDAYNQRLSEQRAKSVLEYLESKGVEASRMGAIGVGEAKPVADNETEEGRELNRRVELRVTAGAAKVAAPAPVAPAATAAPAAEGAPAAETAPAAAPAPSAAPAAEPATDDLDFLN